MAEDLQSQLIEEIPVERREQLVSQTASRNLDFEEENEIKIVPTEHTQAKLLDSLRGKNSEKAVKTILAALELGEFQVEDKGIDLISDEYFDTKDLSINNMQSSLRVRRKSGKLTVTVKRLIGKELGQFKREELSREISETKYSKLVERGFSSIIDRDLPDLKGKQIVSVLKIKNERRNFLLKRANESYCLSFDTFRFENPANKRESEMQLEIEIESETPAAQQKLASIRRNLLPILDTYTPSLNTKYERGVKSFSLGDGVMMKWLNEWNTGIGLTWIGVILGILGIIVTVVLFLLT